MNIIKVSCLLVDIMKCIQYPHAVMHSVNLSRLRAAPALAVPPRSPGRGAMPGFAREPPQHRRGGARGPLAPRHSSRSCRCRSSAAERSGLFKKPPCRWLLPAAKCGRSRALRRRPSVTSRLGEMPPRSDCQQDQLYANGAGGSAGALSTRAAASRSP